MITLLADSHGIGYRAAHSTGSLDSGIAFGFLSTVLQLAERYKTNQCVFCWDGPGSLRKKLFPAYKISRDVKTQEEVTERMMIHTQFNALREHILPKLGFCNHHQQGGYEADDLIAYAIINNPAKSFVVVSSDHDLFQLLQYHNCKGQHLLSNGKLMTSSSFMAEYRIPARDWAAMKAIAGCPGDGVIGVYGIGEKTAIRYVLNELPDGKKRRLLEDDDLSGETIRRNYKLVRLPYPGVKPLTIGKDSFDEETVQEVFSDLGFNSLVAGEQKRRWGCFCRGEFLRG